MPARKARLKRKTAVVDPYASTREWRKVRSVFKAAHAFGEAGAHHHGDDGLEHDSTPASSDTTSKQAQANEIPLRTLVKYACFTATKTPCFWGGTMPVMWLSFFAWASLPALYRLYHGQAGFGTTHLEKYIAAVGFPDLMGSQLSVILFGFAPYVFFTRRRLRMGAAHWHGRGCGGWHHRVPEVEGREYTRDDGVHTPPKPTLQRGKFATGHGRH